MADCTEALRVNPQNPWAYHKRGAAYAAKGAYEKALADYKDSLRVDPANVWAHNALAWLWATCPEAKTRDGRQAVERATSACALSGWKDGDSLDTLAAAHAERGQFDEAVKWANRALDVAPEQQRRAIRARLELYQAGKPYREDKP